MFIAHYNNMLIFLLIYSYSTFSQSLAFIFFVGFNVFFAAFPDEDFGSQSCLSSIDQLDFLSMHTAQLHISRGSIHQDQHATLNSAYLHQR